MRTLTIAAISSGVGASTLASLIYLTAQGRQAAVPSLCAAPGSNLFQRLPMVSPSIVSSTSVIWEVGVCTPGSILGLLRTSTMVVLVAPATPLGHADAMSCLRAAGTSPQNLQEIALVTVSVYGPQRPPKPAFPVAHLHIPYDLVLVKPGPIPNDQRAYGGPVRGVLSQLATLASGGL